MIEDANCIEFSIGGIYSLLLFLSEEVKVSIGKFGKYLFPLGYYTYTGSALGKGYACLKNRLARHRRKEKQNFWHIDYLLANEKLSIESIIIAQTKEKMECNLNSYIRGIKGAVVPVNGFGASDCRRDCGTHLLRFPDIKESDLLIQKITNYLKSLENVIAVQVVCKIFNNYGSYRLDLINY
jgi:Uri superfamily endonuclease